MESSRADSCVAELVRVQGFRSLTTSATEESRDDSLEEQIAADAERGVDRAEDAAGGEEEDGKPRRQLDEESGQHEVHRENDDCETAEGVHAHFVGAADVGDREEGDRDEEFVRGQPGLAPAVNHGEDGGGEEDWVGELQIERQAAVGVFFPVAVAGWHVDGPEGFEGGEIDEFVEEGNGGAFAPIRVGLEEREGVAEGEVEVKHVGEDAPAGEREEEERDGELSVAFRSAKGFPFAERKATMGGEREEEADADGAGGSGEADEGGDDPEGPAAGHAQENGDGDQEEQRFGIEEAEEKRCREEGGREEDEEGHAGRGIRFAAMDVKIEQDEGREEGEIGDEEEGDIGPETGGAGEGGAEEREEGEEGDAGLAVGVVFVAAGGDGGVPFAVPDVEEDVVGAGAAVFDRRDKLRGQDAGEKDRRGRESVDAETADEAGGPAGGGRFELGCGGGGRHLSPWELRIGTRLWRFALGEDTLPPRAVGGKNAYCSASATGDFDTWHNGPVAICVWDGQTGKLVNRL